jgi:hypothetical protein
MKYCKTIFDEKSKFHRKDTKDTKKRDLTDEHVRLRAGTRLFAIRKLLLRAFAGVLQMRGYDGQARKDKTENPPNPNK